MLKFEKYSPDVLKKYSRYIAGSPYNVNDISAGSFYMWNQGVNLAFCEACGSFISMQDICGEPAFSYPFGGDDEKAVEELIRYVEENDLPLKFYGVTEDVLEKMRQNKAFGNLMFNYERKWSDYIYDAEEISAFKGRKFSGQRNHMNKFRSVFGEPDFRPLKKEDISDIKNMLAGYSAEHISSGYEEDEEYIHTLELIDAFFEYDFIGGAIYFDNKPISVTIGEVQGENLIIHIEKALIEYKGVYPTTFNSFVKYAMKLYPQIKIVNREDDSGDMGLRTSKLQYNPIGLINKYIVKVNSPLYGLTDSPVLKAENVVLSEIAENDKTAYRELCTDTDNNKYWGYDYETDPEITGAIDDDTFFDMVVFDRSVGDGISLAIRNEDINSEMIGEVIVYNFTYNKTAEFGIRLMPSEQGKGVAQNAAKLMLDWAENILGVRLRAKCYKENEKSKNLLLSCGFDEINEDSEFYFFAYGK